MRRFLVFHFFIYCYFLYTKFGVHSGSHLVFLHIDLMPRQKLQCNAHRSSCNDHLCTSHCPTFVFLAAPLIARGSLASSFFFSLPLIFSILDDISKHSSLPTIWLLASHSIFGLWLLKSSIWLLDFYFMVDLFVYILYMEVFFMLLGIVYGLS